MYLFVDTYNPYSSSSLVYLFYIYKRSIDYNGMDQPIYIYSFYKMDPIIDV